MIKFSNEFTVSKIEHKSLQKKDGSRFDFDEVTLETGGKYKTYLVARASEEAVNDIAEGKKFDVEIGITSWKQDNGKIWNNFLITNVNPIAAKATERVKPLEVDDDIPF